jgi:thiamine biosynthesis lipoprotein
MAVETGFAWRLEARHDVGGIEFSLSRADQPSGREEGVLPQLPFIAMGCGMLAILDSEAASAQGALARIPAMFERWESVLSRFRPDSELSRLNQADGRTQTASPVLFEVLRLALKMAVSTDGLAVPTLLNALMAAGYDRSFDQLPFDRAALASDGNLAQNSESWRQIRLQMPGRQVSLPPGVRLDFGGIAKGWAADRAVRQLERLGPALVDAGGDIAVSRPRSDGSPWPIGVGDPTGKTEQLAMLAIERGGVATSGLDYRRWKVAGEWQHHLIDPRTGRPAKTDLLAVTVVASSAARAETAAKAVLIQGSERGLQWIESQRSLAALLVGQNGDIVLSRRMDRYVWS